MSRWKFLVPCLALALLPARALAEAPPEESEEEAGRSFVFGFKGAALFAFVGTERVDKHFGGGAFVEVELVEGWIEMEFRVSALSADAAVSVPIDLLFKKPFELSERAALFLGVGPTVLVDVGLEHRDATVLAGVATAFGVDLWFHDHVGFTAELNANLIAEAEPVPEVGVSAGVLFGV